MTLKEIEREAIIAALAAHGGDKISAAKELGIGKTTLYRKLKEYRQEEQRRRLRSKRRRLRRSGSNAVSGRPGGRTG